MYDTLALYLQQKQQSYSEIYRYYCSTTAYRKLSVSYDS